MTNQPPNRTQASLDAPHPAEPVGDPADYDGDEGR